MSYARAVPELFGWRSPLLGLGGLRPFEPELIWLRSVMFKGYLEVVPELRSVMFKVYPEVVLPWRRSVMFKGSLEVLP